MDFWHAWRWRSASETSRRTILEPQFFFVKLQCLFQDVGIFTNIFGFNHFFFLVDFQHAWRWSAVIETSRRSIIKPQVFSREIAMFSSRYRHFHKYFWFLIYFFFYFLVDFRHAWWWRAVIETSRRSQQTPNENTFLRISWNFYYQCR